MGKEFVDAVVEGLRILVVAGQADQHRVLQGLDGKAREPLGTVDSDDDAVPGAAHFAEEGCKTVPGSSTAVGRIDRRRSACKGHDRHSGRGQRHDVQQRPRPDRPGPPWPGCAAPLGFASVPFPTCTCGGAFPDCQRIWELRAPVRRLEAYRAKVGTGIRIVSGCRYQGRNHAVGGAKLSQHLIGAASDIDPLVTVATRREMKLFAGLGFKASTSTAGRLPPPAVSPDVPGF
jgi:hypothetical protein